MMVNFLEATVSQMGSIKLYEGRKILFCEKKTKKKKKKTKNPTYLLCFGGRVFQQIIGNPLGTDCVPLLVDLFLHSYEADFIQGLLKKKKKLARSFHFTFRYIDEILSLNNSLVW